MIASQEAKKQAAQLKSSLDELRGEFASLGFSFREAAKKLETTGTLPSSSLKEAMETVSADFENFKQQVLEFTEECGLEDKPLGSLDELRARIDAAVEATLRAERELAIEPLKKAAGTTRKQGYAVPQLDHFKKQAAEILNRLRSRRLEDFQDELADSQKTIDAFAAVVDLIEQAETLTDEQCEKLRQTAVQSFERTFLISAIRGHLIIQKDQDTPELPAMAPESPLSEAAVPPVLEKKEEIETKDKEEKKAEIVEEEIRHEIWPKKGKLTYQPKRRAPLPLPKKKFDEELVPKALSEISPEDFVEPQPSPQPAHPFSESCLSLEKTLEETPFHEIIMGAITQKKIDPLIDFSAMTKPETEGASQVLQDWVAMSRDLKATTHEVRSILTACGFQVLDIRQEKRHRVGFSVTCKPIRDKSSPDYETSLVKGKYRISCYWGRPSEEMLLAEATDNPDNEIVLIFHFGTLTDERRFELAKLCQDEGQNLIILDDLLLIHLFSMAHSHLEALIASSLPLSYQNRLTTPSVNNNSFLSASI